MNQRKFRMPWQLLLLDLVGAVIVAIGFYRYISGGQGLLLIIVGVAMMAPLVLHLLRFSTSQSRETKNGGENG